MNWNRGFEIAKIARDNSDAPEEREMLGASLFDKSKLITFSPNRWRTHPKARTRTYNLSIHAEHACLIKRRNSNDSNNLTMYVYRQLANGKPAMSRPCTHCIELLKLSNVKRVRYINEQGLYEEMRIRN